MAVHLYNYSNAACHFSKQDVIVYAGNAIYKLLNNYMHFLSTSVQNCLLRTQLPDCCVSFQIVLFFARLLSRLLPLLPFSKFSY